MARFIQGTGGLANIDNDDRIRAEDVTYDNTGGLFPPGTDTVQMALEAAGGGGTVAEMTPTVAGTAYGLQDLSNLSNLTGRDVNGAAVRATGRYQAQNNGTVQQAFYDFAIYDENHCMTDSNTSVANSLVQMNHSELVNSQASDSLVQLTNSLLNDTAVNNATVTGNAAQLHGGATVRNCALTVNDSHLKGAPLDQACIHVTGLTADGVEFDGAVMMGSMTNASINNMRESMFLGSNAGANVTQKGRQSLYVGNQSLAETTNDREAWISSYDRFFLRSLRFDNAPPDMCYYDSGTAELTYGPAPAPYLLPAKQPTVLGGEYGINSAANASQVVGQNSFTNYASGPVQLNGVTAIGQQLYQTSTPASNTFTNDIFLGRSQSFVGASSIQNTLIAANVLGIASISKIADCTMIVPRAASLTLGYVGEANGACFLSSGNVACTIDPLYSSVHSSGGTVNPGSTNAVFSSAPAANSIIMQGSGNVLIQASSNAITYNYPSFSNGCTINTGSVVTLPTASNQLCANSTTLRIPNLLVVGTAASNTSRLMAFDTTTGLMSPVASTGLSRVFRAVGTTGAAGTVVFSTGTISANTAGIAFNATAQNASTTVAYTCQVAAIAATSVTIQVFQSVTVVLASPSMTPSPAGIIVHLSMAW